MAIHTVKFNKEVTFTDQTGVSFVNTTTAETASLVTSATVSPADVIEYSVTWVTDPVAGDVVEFQYAGGNYEDSNGEAMEDQTLVLTNCADIPTAISAVMLDAFTLRVGFNYPVTQDNLDTIEVRVNGVLNVVTAPVTASGRSITYTLSKGVLPSDVVTWDGNGSNIVAVFFDTFTDSGTLGGHVPDVGGVPWVSGGLYIIENNTAKCNGTTTSSATNDIGVADGVITCDMRSIFDAGNNQDCSIRLRFTNDNNCIRVTARTLGTSGFVLSLDERVGGSSAQIGGGTVTGVDWSSGFENISVELSGSTLTAYPTSDPSQSFTLTGLVDTTATGIGFAGTSAGAGAGQFIDNLQVAP